jgi:hypothetical protein
LHYVWLSLLGLAVGTFGTLASAAASSTVGHGFTGPAIRKLLGVALLALAVRLFFAAL